MDNVQVLRSDTQDFFVNNDHLLELIPLYAIVQLIFKAIILCLDEKVVYKSHLMTYNKDKTFGHCFIFAIPILGAIAGAIVYFVVFPKMQKPALNREYMVYCCANNLLSKGSHINKELDQYYRDDRNFFLDVLKECEDKKLNKNFFSYMSNELKKEKEFSEIEFKTLSDSEDSEEEKPKEIEKPIKEIKKPIKHIVIDSKDQPELSNDKAIELVLANSQNISSLKESIVLDHKFWGSLFVQINGLNVSENERKKLTRDIIVSFIESNKFSDVNVQHIYLKLINSETNNRLKDDIELFKVVEKRCPDVCKQLFDFNFIIDIVLHDLNYLDKIDISNFKDDYFLNNFFRKIVNSTKQIENGHVSYQKSKEKSEELTREILKKFLSIKDDLVLSIYLNYINSYKYNPLKNNVNVFQIALVDHPEIFNILEYKHFCDLEFSSENISFDPYKILNKLTLKFPMLLKDIITKINFEFKSDYESYDSKIKDKIETTLRKITLLVCSVAEKYEDSVVPFLSQKQTESGNFCFRLVKSNAKYADLLQNKVTPLNNISVHDYNYIKSIDDNKIALWLTLNTSNSSKIGDTPLQMVWKNLPSKYTQDVEFIIEALKKDSNANIFKLLDNKLKENLKIVIAAAKSYGSSTVLGRLDPKIFTDHSFLIELVGQRENHLRYILETFSVERTESELQQLLCNCAKVNPYFLSQIFLNYDIFKKNDNFFVKMMMLAKEKKQLDVSKLGKKFDEIKNEDIEKYKQSEDYVNCFGPIIVAGLQSKGWSTFSLKDELSNKKLMDYVLENCTNIEAVKTLKKEIQNLKK